MKNRCREESNYLKKTICIILNIKIIAWIVIIFSILVAITNFLGIKGKDIINFIQPKTTQPVKQNPIRTDTLDKSFLTNFKKENNENYNNK